MSMEWTTYGLWLSLISNCIFLNYSQHYKETLTAAETLLYFMENQDDTDYVHLVQIHGYIRKKNRSMENQTKITNILIKLFKEHLVFFICSAMWVHVYMYKYV
jgi:hypothetical protein